MNNLLWLIPILPLAASVFLMLVGYRLPKKAVAFIGCGMTGLSALLTILIGIPFISNPPAGGAVVQRLWTWFRVGDLAPGIAFHLDALSLVMIFVVTVVGFLILLYSTGYMADDDGYSRFFAYMNLFVAAMLILVLADNLLLLYLGWEGVGLCSFLLIGFWYRDAANGRAAMKAFLVTRIGDAALAVGLFLLFTNLGTLHIQDILMRAAALWTPGSAIAVLAAASLLGGAIGKSAQVPLQVWLPDAMAGPTPVSALIHAATMVTAGVYLIARMHPIFELAPPVMTAVAIIGVVTLTIASFSALAQTDLKRALAYSTISQIGYMFLALGVGAWAAAIFHLFTHAFFKALLFLAAGAVIISVHHEQNLFKMGGLRKALPVPFLTFLIGALSLAAFPLVTAGFYSKDLILLDTWASNRGGPWLWAAGLFCALLTALYAFRLVFLVFYGKQRTKPTAGALGLNIQLPLVILAVMALVAGYLDLPRTLGNHPLFSQFLHVVLPSPLMHETSLGVEFLLQLASEVASLLGIALAFLFYLRGSLAKSARSQPADVIRRYWLAGWGFDWVYDRLIVRPFTWVARKNRHDVIDYFYAGIAWLCLQLNRLLSTLQTGNLRWYATGLAVGAVVILVFVVLR